MARTPSTMLELGTEMPDAELSDGNGKRYRLSSLYESHGLMVMFICNHCPFVLHVAPFFATLSARLAKLGIGCVAINANDVAQYPEDAPEKMPEFARHYGLDFPYLFDADQSVAKAFQAACTPDFFLFDYQHALVYRGQMDAARPGSDTPINGEDLLAAAQAVHDGVSPDNEQLPSLGCNIKWKSQAL